jgi:hypothetical protein
MALTALSIGSTALSFLDQRQQANAQVNAIEDSWNAQIPMVHDQIGQINDNAEDQMSQRAREALIERGRIRAIQGESGLIGNTQDRIVGESYFNEATDMASIESNRKNQVMQTINEANGNRASAQSKINTVKQPSLIGAGLMIGTDAVKGYAAYQDAKASKSSTSTYKGTATASKPAGGASWSS